MIEFLQDYVTKSLPPETFEAGQQVARSEESESYFVRLGVAGFVVNGQLLDADFAPIAREPVAVVVTTDRRFAGGGRAGEVIGLAAPQRATSGPGNAVVFGGQPDNLNLSPVEAEQLRADLAASIAQFDEHRTESAKQIETLTTDLTAVQGEREAALSDLAALRGDHEKALSDLSANATLIQQHDERAKADAETIAQLKQELAAAKAPRASAKGGEAK